MLIRMGMGGQLSGSVGGVVASHNKGGAYLRNRSVPTNPRTNLQQSVRAAFASAALGWKALTSAERTGWEGYASATPVTNRLGESITLSGFNMYVRAAAFFIGANNAAVATPPAFPGLASLGDLFVVTSFSAANGITVDGVGAGVDGPFQIAIGPALSAGVSSFGGPFSSFLLSLSGESLSDIESVATAANVSPLRYGPPVQGQRRAVRVAAAAADGRLSEVFQTIVTVAA